LELILDDDAFDCNDLVDEVEGVAYKHAKYQNCSLDNALSLLDKVESWEQRLDIRSPTLKEVLPVAKVSPIGPVYTWLAKSQGVIARRGYLAVRRFDPFSN